MVRFRSPEGFRRRWKDDNFLDSDPRLLVVAQPDDAVIGSVSWRQGVLGAQAGVLEIGALWGMVGCMILVP